MANCTRSHHSTHGHLSAETGRCPLMKLNQAFQANNAHGRLARDKRTLPAFFACVTILPEPNHRATGRPIGFGHCPKLPVKKLPPPYLFGPCCGVEFPQNSRLDPSPRFLTPNHKRLTAYAGNCLLSAPSTSNVLNNDSEQVREKKA